MKRALVFLAMVMVLVAVTVNPAICEDKQVSGYYTTDMWLLGVSPYKPVALDHSILDQMSRSAIRSLDGVNGIQFVYHSQEYDVAVLGTLIIAVYYLGDNTSNIICLGDIVQ